MSVKVRCVWAVLAATGAALAASAETHAGRVLVLPDGARLAVVALEGDSGRLERAWLVELSAARQRTVRADGWGWVTHDGQRLRIERQDGTLLEFAAGPRLADESGSTALAAVGWSDYTPASGPPLAALEAFVDADDNTPALAGSAGLAAALDHARYQALLRPFADGSLGLPRAQAPASLDEGPYFPDPGDPNGTGGGCKRTCSKSCPFGSCSATCAAGHCAVCGCHPTEGIPLCGCN